MPEPVMPFLYAFGIGTNDTYPFTGAVHTKDFRTPGCINYGNGSQIVTLGINLLAPQGAPDYCGVFVNNDTSMTRWSEELFFRCRRSSPRQSNAPAPQPLSRIEITRSISISRIFRSVVVTALKVDEVRLEADAGEVCPCFRVKQRRAGCLPVVLHG
ncbi:hypothetical protein U1Q18_050053 [Sarracenia purpurea var. burkii]